MAAGDVVNLAKSTSHDHIRPLGLDLGHRVIGAAIFVDVIIKAVGGRGVQAAPIGFQAGDAIHGIPKGVLEFPDHHPLTAARDDINNGAVRLTITQALHHRKITAHVLDVIIAAARGIGAAPGQGAVDANIGGRSAGGNGGHIPPRQGAGRVIIAKVAIPGPSGKSGGGVGSNYKAEQVVGVGGVRLELQVIPPHQDVAGGTAARWCLPPRPGL